MATSDLSLALAYELDPVLSVRDVLDLGTDPWARLDRRDCAAFGSDPRVCTAPRGPIRMLTIRLLTKGSGSVPGCRRRPRSATTAEVHLMMAKQ